jgi:intracellular sulfur oxidation DsrE/DsrF family protein
MMSSSRRNFLGAAAANAAALAIMPGTVFASLPSDLAPVVESDEWDLSWPAKLSGKYRAVFDCSEPESGYGVWRASAWAGQYKEVMKAAPGEISPAIILRHAAIILAMQQPFWDKYNIGEKRKVTHPLTGEPTKKNPVLLDEKDGIPAPFNNAGLRKQLDRGVVVLACNLALQDCIDLIKATDKVSDEVARKQALGYLVPGVILQPSGVFAAVRAQEAGAAYVKAS